MNQFAFDSTNSSFGLNLAKAAGTRVAIRYFSLDGKSGWKILKTAEADSLRQEGFAILPVFQYAGNKMSAFSGALGTRDAENAIISAGRFSLPEGTTIFFAVDFDAAGNQISGPIEAYFRSVRAVLQNHATLYRVGVYGSGLVCRMLHSEGLVDLTWLAQATGWREYSTYNASGNWTLKQSAIVSGNGGDFNFDAVNGDIGALGAFVYDANGSRLITGVDANGDFLTEGIQNAPPPQPQARCRFQIHGPVSYSRKTASTMEAWCVAFRNV